MDNDMFFLILFTFKSSVVLFVHDTIFAIEILKKMIIEYYNDI